MKKLMVAAVAGAMAFGASAGTFLDSLNADERKVLSSPYSSGGDIILQIDENEYVVVFTNTAATATFTALEAISPRALLVGGGGAGGGTTYYGSGGGGAGGMLEVASIPMMKDAALSIMVGSGCKTIQNKGGSLNNGSPTFISDQTSGVELHRVLGGGGGGGDNVAGDGGSGGGGATRMAKTAGGKGETGQGCDGGSGATELWGGSGGGGAEGPGETFTGGSTGAGGIGRISTILGPDQYFAGGGAGRSAVGGLGGGGNGSNSSVKNAVNGEDGLGGGGAGGSTGSGMGTGGDGIVIFRYTYIPLSTTVPEVEASINKTLVTASNFIISVTLRSTGSQPTADLEALYGYAADALTQRQSLKVGASAGAYDFGIPVDPGQHYFIKIVADNHAATENVGETEVLDVTAAVPFDGIALATSRGKWTLSSDVLFLGNGANTVGVAIGSSAEGEFELVDNSLMALSEIGPVQVVANLYAAGYPFDGITRHARLMHVCVPADGGPTVTNWSAIAQAVLKDTGTFQLVSAGVWTDAAIWAGPEASEYGAPYPVSGSTATIKADVTGVVEVAGTAFASSGFFNSGSGHALTFRGVGAGAEISLAPASVFDYFLGTNVFDNIALAVSTQNGFGNNRLGTFFGVINGATVTCNPAFSQLDTTMTIANAGKLTFSGSRVVCHPGVSWTFEGLAPALTLKGSLDAPTDGAAKFLFAIPEEGYEVAPVTSDKVFPSSGNVLVALLPKRDQPLRKRGGKAVDIPLVKSSAGFNQNLIAFGDSVFAGSFFFYSEDGKTLLYHYEPSKGLMLLVR